MKNRKISQLYNLYNYTFGHSNTLRNYRFAKNHSK